jgi:serine/threonine protein kinase
MPEPKRQRIHDGLAGARDLLRASESRCVTSKYRFGALLGTGASAWVIRGTNKGTNEVCAIKLIPKSHFDALEQRAGASAARHTGVKCWKDLEYSTAELIHECAEILREIAAMLMLDSHPHTVSVYDCFEDEENFYMVMELCAWGELFNTIVQRQFFHEREAATIMKAIISVMSACHEVGIIHRCLPTQECHQARSCLDRATMSQFK